MDEQVTRIAPGNAAGQDSIATGAVDDAGSADAAHLSSSVPDVGIGGDAAAVGGPTWERLEDQLSYYSRASRRAKQSFHRVKVAELVVAATVPVVAALQAPAAVTAVLAALVVVAEGLQQLFGWQRDWLGYRGVLQDLKREKFLFLAGGVPYARPDRHQILAARLEDLIGGENTTWAEVHTPRTDQRRS